MEAIKKIATIKNGSISLKELEALNNQEVEVIILPLISHTPQESTKAKSQKERLFQFEGAIESDFTDTSTKVDKLIYGE